MSDEQRVMRENLRLAAIIYSLVKHHPNFSEWSVVLEDAAHDELPDRIRIGYNTVGDDAIVTVLTKMPDEEELDEQSTD